MPYFLLGGVVVIYELREYSILPERMAAWKENFSRRVMPGFEKHGIKVVGCWEVAVGPNYAGPGGQGSIVYLLAFPDMAAFQTSWAEFRAELASQRAAQETAGVKRESNVWRIDNRILYPTDFSPMQ